MKENSIKDIHDKSWNDIPLQEIFTFMIACYENTQALRKVGNNAFCQKRYYMKLKKILASEIYQSA